MGAKMIEGLQIDRVKKAAGAHFREDALDLPVEVAGAVDEEVGMGGGWADEGDAGGTNRGFILCAN